MHFATNGKPFYRQHQRTPESESSADAQLSTLQKSAPRRVIAGLRWWIIGLIFVITCIN